MCTKNSDFKIKIFAFTTFSKEERKKQTKRNSNLKRVKEREKWYTENHRKFTAFLLHCTNIKYFSDITDIKIFPKNLPKFKLVDL